MGNNGKARVACMNNKAYDSADYTYNSISKHITWGGKIQSIAEHITRNLPRDLTYSEYKDCVTDILLKVSRDIGDKIYPEIRHFIVSDWMSHKDNKEFCDKLHSIILSIKTNRSDAIKQTIPNLFQALKWFSEDYKRIERNNVTSIFRNLSGFITCVDIHDTARINMYWNTMVSDLKYITEKERKTYSEYYPMAVLDALLFIKEDVRKPDSIFNEYYMTELEKSKNWRD